MEKKTLILVLLLFAGVLSADIIELSGGIRIKGRILEETDTHIRIKRSIDEIILRKTAVKMIVRSRWVVHLPHGIRMTGEILGNSGGILTLKTGLNSEPVEIDSSTVLSVEEKGIPVGAFPRRNRIDPGQLYELRVQGLDHLGRGEYRQALEMYGHILRAYPEDTNALYNTACAWAGLGMKKRALEFLKTAVDWGFIDFTHMTKDPDLALIRDMQGFADIISHRKEFVSASQKGTISILSEQLLEKGVWIGSYRVLNDPERMMSFVFSCPEQELEKIRTRLVSYAAVQWKNLFDSRPGSPVYIVLLSRRDTPKVLDGVGGLYNPGTNVLLCGSSGMNSLLNSNVVLHEFTHALHWGDSNARGQAHPIWLQEGLASLFESSQIGDGRAVPVHSYRLGVIQSALVNSQTVPWNEFIRMGYVPFMQRATLCYAQARYMLFYLYGKGVLKTFYDSYTDDSAYTEGGTSQEAFRKALGKDIDAAEEDWKNWILGLDVPEVPFLGILPKRGPSHVQVEKVLKGSAAHSAGLASGDIIDSLDGTPVLNWDDLLEALSTRKPGDRVTLSIRRFRKTLTLTAVLTEKGTTLREIHNPGF